MITETSIPVKRSEYLKPLLTVAGAPAIGVEGMDIMEQSQELGKDHQQ